MRIREAAKMMDEQAVTALLVRTRDGLGIVTDADLRTKVLAGELCPQAPIGVVARTPVKTMRGDDLVPEASIEMALAGIDHLAVVDRRGQVIGVLSASDLTAIDALSPFGLRLAIVGAQNDDQLVLAAAQLPLVFLRLLDAHLSAAEIGRILAAQHDALTGRLIELAVQRHGTPPVDYAWLAFGSAARGELTPASDQDNALVYEDSDDPEVRAYFARLTADVADGLARCGFALDTFGVSAREPRWRMSRSAWAHDLASCLATHDLVRLVRAATVLDYRCVAGTPRVAAPFAEFGRLAPAYPGFLARLSGTATRLPSPLTGLRHRLTGTIDIKRGAARPLANLARYFALANGVGVAPTLDRLAAVEELGTADAPTAAVLHEAFFTVSRLRLERQAAAIRVGRSPDDLLDTEQVPPLAKLDLQAALRAVRAAQRQLAAQSVARVMTA